MKFLKGFYYAFKGIFSALVSEFNLRVHFVVALCVIIIGLYLSLSIYEWVGIFFAIGLVVVSELFNTSIEKIVDFISPEHNKKAGQIKDIAAGAVLFAAFIAVIIGLIIFVPKICF